MNFNLHRSRLHSFIGVCVIVFIIFLGADLSVKQKAAELERVCTETAVGTMESKKDLSNRKYKVFYSVDNVSYTLTYDVYSISSTKGVDLVHYNPANPSQAYYGSAPKKSKLSYNFFMIISISGIAAGIGMLRRG